MIPLPWILAAGAAALSWIGVRTRPAARARRRARKAVRRVERELAGLGRLDRRARGALETRARAYARHAAEERLAAVSVEELRGFGAEKVRWGVLQDAGLRTVADVAHARRAELEALDGIGPKSARRIARARKALLAANREEPALPPALGDDDRTALATVRGARDVLAVRDALGSSPRELEELALGLRERFRGVRKGTGLLRELTAEGRATRDAAVDEAGRIVAEVEAAEADEGVLDRAGDARERARRATKERTGAEELRGEHERRYAEFCAVIEQALPGRAIRRAGSLRGGLPEEIAARVEELELRADSLSLTLRGYQEFGAKYALVQQRTLLGDEMGLGKTIEALAVLCHLSEVGDGRRFLVVCPASVLHNWQREVHGHSDLRAHLLHGEERDERFARWRVEGGVGVTSFRTLQTLLEDALEEGGGGWPRVDALVVDEAHYVKNPEARRTRAVAAVGNETERVLFLTGTPLENRLAEFRALVALLQPVVSARLDRDVSATGDLVIGRRAFQEAVAPVYLRRNQEDVLRELPERIDKEEWVELSPEELAAYEEAVARQDIMAMRRTATIGAGGVRSAKLERLEELLEEYREEGRKVLLLSFFLDVLAACEERFTAAGRITGATPPAERQELVDAFTERPGHALLLAQIQAGGVGLNIQAASVVVLLEPQWKPSTEEQAIARAHRMGQTRTVVVHRMLADDCVDERMKEVLAEKAELFEAFARESLIKDASPEATEATLVRRVIEAEVERLGRRAEAT